MNTKTKFIFITGGVVSSLGKGLASASLGSILQGHGFKVRLRKCDPYLNVNPGLLSPYQHGEVFITDDGTEADLDLGHYERFSGVCATRFDSVTSGKIYQRVLEKERLGVFNGATIQVVPHVTNEIKEFILSGLDDEDFVLCEIGGTVGDIEGRPYLEAIRQIAYELGKERVMFMHLTLLPYIKTAGELKTKPTQHSVKQLQGYGIQPDLLLCRSEIKVEDAEKRKLALFCNVKEENVITALDVKDIYEVPLSYAAEGLDRAVCKYFNVSGNKVNLKKWADIMDSVQNPQGEVTIGVVGRYTTFSEAYKSLHEAIKHGAIANKYKAKIKWINAEDIEKNSAEACLKDVQAIIVADDNGQKETEGEIKAIEYARIHQLPFLGIGLGMQLAALEVMRHILGIQNAGSVEFDTKCAPVICKLKNMYLGAFPCCLQKNTKAFEIYGSTEISERHKHIFGLNPEFEEMLSTGGLIVSGKAENDNRADIIELKEHPFFIGVQFRPEFKSKPFAPHPLFAALVRATIEKNRLL